MLKKIGRLFTIKTRFEAWLVIYAIALGAVERGRLYLHTYPGWGGWLLAAACTGVVFIAGPSCSIPLESLRSQLNSFPIAQRFDAETLLVVIDPRPCGLVALQRYRFHVAEIDFGPGHRT